MPDLPVPIYVPTGPRLRWLAMFKARGAAIVGQPFDSAKSLVYYEEMRLHNTQTFHGRVEVAALRWRDEAPTHKKLLCPTELLTFVGYYSTDRRIYLASDEFDTSEEALMDWLMTTSIADEVARPPRSVVTGHQTG